MAAGGAFVIVFANEKGGTGKSTTAVHVSIALSKAGFSVAAIDMDTRQKSLARYLQNRLTTAKHIGIKLETPLFCVFDPDSDTNIVDQLDSLGSLVDFVVIDTPGRHDLNTFAAIMRAELVVTPINDSFMDLDLIGEVDPITNQLARPSILSRLIWDARQQRAARQAGPLDWVVLRNRLQHIQALNKRFVGEILEQLSTTIGFRALPGLTERVIYREMFNSGLTLFDAVSGQRGMRKMVTALEEITELMRGLSLPNHKNIRRASSPAQSYHAVETELTSRAQVS